jgi:hypothetical protein
MVVVLKQEEEEEADESGVRRHEVDGGKKRHPFDAALDPVDDGLGDDDGTGWGEGSHHDQRVSVSCGQEETPVLREREWAD